MLKIYLIMVCAFWICMSVGYYFLGLQYKKEGYVVRKSSITKRIENWTKTILISLIPFFNVLVGICIIFCIYMITNQTRR